MCLSRVCEVTGVRIWLVVRFGSLDVLFEGGCVGVWKGGCNFWTRKLYFINISFICFVGFFERYSRVF